MAPQFKMRPALSLSNNGILGSNPTWGRFLTISVFLCISPGRYFIVCIDCKSFNLFELYDKELKGKRTWLGKLILHREAIKAGQQTTQFIKFNELANNI